MKKRAIAGMILLLCLAACLRIYQVNEQCHPAFVGVAR